MRRRTNFMLVLKIRSLVLTEMTCEVQMSLRVLKELTRHWLNCFFGVHTKFNIVCATHAKIKNQEKIT